MARTTRKPAPASPGATFSLSDLGQAGGFVSDLPVLRTITWGRSHLGKDPIDLDVWVRQMNADDFESLLLTPKGEPRMAATVARLVSFGPAGDEKLTVEQASKLDPYLVLALTAAINEVSPEGKP